MMKGNSYLFVYIISGILLSCSSQKTHQDINIEEFSCRIDTNYIYNCTLAENKGYLNATITSFQFLSDSIFVLSDGKNVFAYNMAGIQLFKIGDRGRGPSEYISADKIYVSKKYIYIWCGQTLKLNKYNHDGKFVTTYGGFKKAIKNVAIREDRYAYFYQAYTPEENVVCVYDLEKAQIIDQIGTFTGQDIIPLLNAASKALTIDDNSVYFAKPGDLAIYVYNDDSGVRVHQIIDKDFNCMKVENAKEIINNNLANAIEIMCKTGSVNEISVQNKNIYLLSENGEIKRTDKGYDFSKRFYKIYKFNLNFSPVTAVKIPYNMRIISYCFHNQYFYTIHVDDSGKYVVKTMNI